VVRPGQHPRQQITAKGSQHIAAAPKHIQKQHVEFYRKMLLRKRMLRWAKEGPAYVPFIGDGDLAAKLYTDRMIYGADIDPARVQVASSRLPNSQVIVADCDLWVFPDLKDKIAIADFDPYADCYTSFKNFWRNAPKTDRLVLFFTDGRRQGLQRTWVWHKPDGSKVTFGSLPEMQEAFNGYLSRYIWPWFEEHIKPWRIVDKFRYQRGLMVYWSAVVECPAPKRR
jgi:hypothetical protein